MSDTNEVKMVFNAPVTGAAGKVEGDMVIHHATPKQEAAIAQLQSLLQNLRQKYPNATDAEIFETLTRGFETMPKTNPQNWQRWRNMLSVIFAGAVEGTKIVVPVAGIPIEILKRLYEIYDRNQRQLPG